MMSHIRIVLVEPEKMRNVGSVVRIAANFGLANVFLVREQPLSADEVREARVASAGAMGLVQLHKLSSLKSALSDTSHVIGTSARRRDVAVRIGADFTGLLQQLNAPLPRTDDTVAVIFGRESQGLTAEELSLCHGLLSLPVSERFPSMNLSHAVAVILAQALWKPDKAEPVAGAATASSGIAAAADDIKRASRDLQERWLERIAALAGDADVHLDLQQLRYLLYRASPGEGEMALLFNLLKINRRK